MRKTIQFFALVVLAFLTFNAYTQTFIGPKAGINIAKWGGDGITENEDALKSITVFQFGAVAEFRTNERVALQSELLYFQKGVGFEETESGLTYSSETTLNYLELPILAKVYLTDGPTQIFVIAGPSFGYGLDGKSTFEFEGEEEEMDIDFEDDNLTRLDISAAFGVGIQAPVGPGEAFIDGRYLLGLNTLDNTEEKDDRVDIMNRGIVVSVGFLFPIGG